MTNEPTSAACEWCGRAVTQNAEGRWYAVKGDERGYDPMACEASDDGRHSPDQPATAAGQRWWQRCRWEVVGSDYEPPGGDIETGPAEGVAALRVLRLSEQIIQGFTTLTLRCVLCGDVKTRIEPGRVTL